MKKILILTFVLIVLFIILFKIPIVKTDFLYKDRWYEKDKEDSLCSNNYIGLKLGQIVILKKYAGKMCS